MASVRITKTTEQILIEAYAPLLAKICRARIVYSDVSGKDVLSMNIGHVNPGDRIESFRVPTVDDITFT
jgi:hypothetical protein